MAKRIQKRRCFIIPITISQSDLKPFKFKIPAEFVRIDGFAFTHSHYPGIYAKGDLLPQIAQLSVSFNNKASNPINIPVIDNPTLDVTTKKPTWLPLDETTLPGEYVEGYVEDFGLSGDYTMKIYLKGVIEYSE